MVSKNSTIDARAELQTLLEQCVVDINGELLTDNRVHYMAGDSAKLDYPCILYSRRYADQKQANNSNYSTMIAYSVTVITRDGENTIPKNILDLLPTSRWQNDFTADGLYHSVFLIYHRV